MRDLPIGTISRHVFVSVFTERQREVARVMMVRHSIDIGEVKSFDIHRRDVVYTLYVSNDDGYRYLDAASGEVAVRTVRHKIKQRPTGGEP